MPIPPATDLSDYRHANDGDSYLEYMDVYVEVDGSLLGAGSLRHYDVIHPQTEEKLGEIRDVALERGSGDAAYLLVQPEDFLRAELAPVSVDAFSLSRPDRPGAPAESLMVERKLYLNLPKEEVEAMAGFELSEDFDAYVNGDSNPASSNEGAELLPSASAVGASAQDLELPEAAMMEGNAAIAPRGGQSLGSQGGYVLVFRDGAGSIEPPAEPASAMFNGYERDASEAPPAPSSE